MNNSISLAARGFRRSAGYYTLCSLIIAVGVSAFAAMGSVLAYLYASPAPAQHTLLHPNYVETSQGTNDPLLNFSGMPWLDAIELSRAASDFSLSATFVAGSLILVHESQSPRPIEVSARFTTRDFFQVFDVPMLVGTPWSNDDDERAARVAVISKSLAEELFGTTRAQGEVIQLDDTPFRIAGILDDWNPKPHYYDLGQGAYANADDVYIPLATARSIRSNINAAISCANSFPNPDELETSDCSWVQLWYRAASDEDVTRLRRLHENYGASRATNVDSAFEVYTADEWISSANVIPGIVRAQTLIAAGFLAACIVNVSAIILVIALRNKHTIGVHRAMGATRRNIVSHLLIEAGGIAAIGSLAGIVLIFAIFATLRLRPEEYYQHLSVGAGAVVASIALSIAATLAAAILPAIYLSRVQPVKLLASS